jgi:hypothetical protein
MIPPGISALSLREAESEEAWLNELIRLLRYRDGVDTLPFHIPRRAGPVGWAMARLKKILWQFLRYQHDRIAFRQNLINTLLLSALEFEDAQRRKDADEWRKRVAALESARAAAVEE